MGDRNLYVTGAAYDGTTATNGTLTLMSGGAQSLVVGKATPAPVAPVVPPTLVVGSGPDTVDLKVSEDAFQGDAQFTVAVDGKQIGGILTAQSLHGSGTDQDVLVEGGFGKGVHTVGVSFLNDSYVPGVGDRNLYVDGASYDGIAATGSTLALYSAGTQSLTVGAAVPPTATTSPDTLDLGISEDAYQGNAQFTVSVDGKQVGGTYTAAASHAAGQSQQLDLTGNWGVGRHTVAVDFLNDNGGYGPTDRNLYVTSASYDGVAQPDASLNLYAGGTQAFTATSSTTYSEDAATTYSEDAAGGAVTTLGNDTVVVGSGNVTIHADGPSAKAVGGTGAMTFIASSGNDTITAGAGACTVMAGSGTLSFIAGSGLATITAGTGKEAFDFIDGQAGGLLTIDGFQAGTDIIHLQGYAGSGVQSQQAAPGGSTLITLTDGSRITLAGYAASSAHPVFG